MTGRICFSGKDICHTIETITSWETNFHDCIYTIVIFDLINFHCICIIQHNNDFTAVVLFCFNSSVDQVTLIIT